MTLTRKNSKEGVGVGRGGGGGRGQPDSRCLTSRPGDSLSLSLTTMQYPLPYSIRYRVNGVGDVHTFFLLHAVV